MGIAMISFSALVSSASGDPTWILPVFKGFVAFQTVALFSLYMKISWTTAAATQFTLYMAVSNFGTFLGNEISRIDGLERSQLFMISGVSALIPLIVIFLLRPDSIVELRRSEENAS